MAANFDDAALSRLTAKIDSKLSDSMSQNKKRKQITGTADAPPNKKNKGSNERKTADNAASQSKSSNKKKDKVKDQTARPNGKGPITTSPMPKNQANNAELDDLLEEIKALGGNEDDLRLVEDVETDVDGDEAADCDPKTQHDSIDSDLRKELAEFAAGLGFENVAPESTDDESEIASQIESDVNDQQDGDEEEVEEEEEEEEEQETTDGGDQRQGGDVNANPSKNVKRNNTVFEQRPDWHAVSLNNLPATPSEDTAPFAPAVASLKTHAQSLLDDDTTAYAKDLSASSTHRFMSSIMSSGTMTDKVSALTLAIQDSPVHSVKAFESLMALASKRNRGQALAALSALVDLLGPGMILPPNRRLKPFSGQLELLGTLQRHKVRSWSPTSSLPGKITREHLISWTFEDWLKTAYFKIIQLLEVWCDDEVEYARTKAVDLVYALLRDKPEQESNLLRLLVNKLGDRQRKISSRASYLLLQLLNLHPGMKAVVIRAVEQDVLFRPGQNIRAKYYAINTLNQTILSSKEPELAESLLRIYFALFVSLLRSGQVSQIDDNSQPAKSHGDSKTRPAEKSSKAPMVKGEQRENGDGEAAEKLVSAILTGINRAVPFSQTDQSTLESHLDTLFRITHSSNFNTSIQALMLIQQLSASRHVATERFYRTLYESLLDPRLSNSSKQTLYLNLLYRSLKSDIDVRRVKAFVKRLLQILHLHQPSFVCGVLYLVIELTVTFPDLKTLLNVPEEHDFDTEQSEADKSEARLEGQYDGRKRDPEYSNAHRSCLWELIPFLSHFHPSVHVYASSLLSGEQTSQKPELAHHTLIAFLDKFVYRNAKAVDPTRGASIMQPVASGDQQHVLLSKKGPVKVGGALNTASFWNQKSEDVAVDDVFFHEYFAQMGKPGQAHVTKKAKKESEDKDKGSQDGEDADEDEIWDALVSSRPDVQGDDSDDDDGFEDLMAMEDSDDELGADGSIGDEDEVMDEGLGGEAGSSSDGGVEFWDDSASEPEGDGVDENDGGFSEEEPSSTMAEKKKPVSARTARKKALRALPTFASADDYADMLAQEEDI